MQQIYVFTARLTPTGPTHVHPYKHQHQHEHQQKHQHQHYSLSHTCTHKSLAQKWREIFLVPMCEQNNNTCSLVCIC